MVAVSDTFPRQYARTQRLTLGEPRNLRVSADGKRVVFLRSARRRAIRSTACGCSTSTRRGAPRRRRPRSCSATPTPTTTCMTDEERARRERLREGAGGVTAFATDEATTVVAFAVGGRLFVAGLLSGRARAARRRRSGVRPATRPDGAAGRLRERSDVAHRRAGRSVAGARRRRPDDGRPCRGAAPTSSPPRRWAGTAATGGAPTAQRSPPAGSTTRRSRNGTSPIRPTRRAGRTVRYPAAGTDNADVTLHVLGLDGSGSMSTGTASSSPTSPPSTGREAGLLLSVISRDQRGSMTLRVDADDGRDRACSPTTTTTRGSISCPACPACCPTAVS